MPLLLDTIQQMYINASPHRYRDGNLARKEVFCCRFPSTILFFRSDDFSFFVLVIPREICIKLAIDHGIIAKFWIFCDGTMALSIVLAIKLIFQRSIKVGTYLHFNCAKCIFYFENNHKILISKIKIPKWLFLSPGIMWR